MDRVVTKFLQMYCDPASLVLVVNCSPSQQVQVQIVQSIVMYTGTQTKYYLFSAPASQTNSKRDPPVQQKCHRPIINIFLFNNLNSVCSLKIIYAIFMPGV